MTIWKNSDPTAPRRSTLSGVLYRNGFGLTGTDDTNFIAHSTSSKEDSSLTTEATFYEIVSERNIQQLFEHAGDLPKAFKPIFSYHVDDSSDAASINFLIKYSSSKRFIFTLYCTYVRFWEDFRPDYFFVEIAMHPLNGDKPSRFCANQYFFEDRDGLKQIAVEDNWMYYYKDCLLIQTLDTFGPVDWTTAAGVKVERDGRLQSQQRAH